MSIITLPAGFRVPAGCTIGQQRYDMTESSDTTGDEAARLLGPPRWSMSLRSVDALTLIEAGLWESVVLKLRGRVNHLAMYDPVRSAPQGTLRGTPTLDATVLAGVSVIVLTGVSTGSTLLPGDWLQIGTGVGTSQLIKVVEAATESGGKLTATFEPPLRTGYTAGAAITWDKPVAYFKQTGNPQWGYRPAPVYRATAYTIDLIESWTP